MTLSPDDVLFCLLSFEGPDPYSLAGGLGVRITPLAETLAERGFETHLFFVGDPDLPGRESQQDGRLTWHYETFGEHHGADTGIFNFLDALLGVAKKAGLPFTTAAEVSASFTPQEWRPLGPDGIIREIQQVYRNFITALDGFIPPFQARKRRAVP